MQLLALTSLLAGGLLTPELSFDDGPIVPASGRQTGSAVASDGNGHWLVAWSDSRPVGSVYDLWATVVDANGAPMSPRGVVVSSEPVDEVDVTVAFGAGRFLVVWRHDYDDLYAAFVSPAGQVLAPGRFPVATFGVNERPRAAFDGTDFVVAWSRDSSPMHLVYSATISTAGVVTPANGARLLMQSSNQQSCRVACTGSAARDCLVVWSDNVVRSNYDVYGARVVAGVNQDPSGFVIEGSDAGKSAPAAAWNGAHWLVTWTQNTGNADIWAARIDAAGARFDSAAALTTSFGDQSGSRVVRNGNGWLVAWINDSQTRAEVMRLDADAGRIDPAPVTACPSCNNNWTMSEPAVAEPAMTGGPPLLVWTDERRGDSDLFGARLGSPPQNLDDGGLPLVFSQAAQDSAAVAQGAGRYLLVWSDSRNGGRGQIVGTELDSRGVPLFSDGGVIRFTDPNDPSQRPNSGPRVAFGGGRFFVVWSGDVGNNTTVFGRSWQPGTGLVEAAPYALADAGAPSEFRPVIAAGATQFLLAYDQGSGTRARRIPFGSAPLDPLGLPVSSTSMMGDNDDVQTVEAVGDTFIVLFARANSSNSSSFIRAARVDAQGSAPDGPDGVRLSGTSQFDGHDARLSCQAGTCLSVWTEGSDIQARLFDPALQLQPSTIALSRASGVQANPSIAWQQSRWLVSWSDRRNGVSGELWSSPVFADGGVAAPTGTLLVASPASLSRPAIASAAAGSTLVAYAAYDEALGAHRVKARALLELPLGASCTEAGPCVSGYCVDGVCCDGACGGGSTFDCQRCSAAGVCVVEPATVTCRTAVSVCDVAERCDGTGLICPADVTNPDDTACNGDGKCTQGVCVGGTPPTPGIVTTPAVFLTCSETFRYNTEGRPMVNGPGPVTWSLQPLPGEELPEGLTIDPDTGIFTWTPKVEQAGMHRVVLVARGAGWVATQTLELDVECMVRQSKVACSCGSEGGLGFAVLLLAARLRRSRLFTSRSA